ncbi:peptide chain release factor N(5)-glutamine methyltransferase [Chitinivorax sp. B]|uniref:peptide chain release factor N(5)-glutamine methyltransferase n=1 Tax=Chitinivorax sp. B TaxID=2502235 RepID=UPI0010F9E9E3|nr:peptide chain release factor N(5)-glutamine methyltransferase [Chitinivorax sp. B]
MPTYREFLKATGLDPVDARVLLCYALQVNAAWLAARQRDDMPITEQAKVLPLMARRQAGEPVAYITGEREFYSLPFQVSPSVLIPRPETELLVELALNRLLPDQAEYVLDLGTGSGIIAVTIAHHRPRAHVWAVDASTDALQIAQANAIKLAPGNVTCVKSDWYQALPGELQFHLIVSNPPYIVADDPHLATGDLRYEPISALTDHADGLACIRAIIVGAEYRLLPGGWLLFEHGYDQAAAVRQLLLTAGFEHVHSERDLAGIERVTLGQLPRSAIGDTIPE